MEKIGKNTAWQRPVWNALVGVSLVALITSGLTGPLPIRTEGLRIAIAEQMNITGDWVVPHLWGEPILTKPPGFYWTVALAQKIAGWDSLAAMRFVSILALLAIAWVGAGEFRDRTGITTPLFIPVLASLAATLASMGQVPSAEMDIPFAFWILWFWVVAFRLGRTKRDSGAHKSFVLGALGLGLIGGMAVLFKWTGPAFFFPAWVWLVGFSPLTARQKIVGSVLCFTAACLLPCLWIAGVVHKVGWEPFFQAVLSEALPHLSPAHHTRAYPFWEWISFPMLVVGMALPAGLPLLVLPFGRLKWLQKTICQPWPFVLLGSILFWTLMPGHRPRHALPIPLALALLATPYWLRWMAAIPFRAYGLGIGLMGLAMGKALFSLGLPEQWEERDRLGEEAHQLRLLIGEDALGLDRVKEDGFVWQSRIPKVLRISKGETPLWVLCDQNQMGFWVEQDYQVRKEIQHNHSTKLILLSKGPKT